MTAYRRNQLAWACIMIVAFAFILLSLYLSKWFLLPLFAMMTSVQFLLNRIVCPKCGTPVTYQGSVAAFRVKGGFIRRKCQQCGWDLGTNP
jgi:hypothetical protein